jgi:hypothetical protein
MKLTKTARGELEPRSDSGLFSPLTGLSPLAMVQAADLNNGYDAALLRRSTALCSGVSLANARCKAGELRARRGTRTRCHQNVTLTVENGSKVRAKSEQ